jgi:hypothetical protein
MRRNIGALGLALVCSIAAAQTVNVPSTTQPGTSSPYDTAYNRASQVSLTGTVVGIGASKPNKDMPTNTRLIVQTLGKRSSTVLVELGPQWFVSDQRTRPRLGQWVKVTGSKITDHGQTKILAMNVELHNHDVLALRRPNGTPYWADMSTSTSTYSADNESNTPAIGTILASGTFNVNGSQYQGYVVQTSNGPQNIVVMQQNQPTYNQPVQSYSMGGVNVIGGGYWPVISTGGPQMMNGLPNNPGYASPNGMMISGGPLWFE